MLNRSEITSVINSSYEFSHWDRSAVNFEIGVLRLFEEDDLSGNPWSMIFATFLSDIWVQFQSSYQLCLFFCSPVWMPNTKINRYYGLWEKLSKEYSDISDLDIVSESYHEVGSKIRFSGIARVQPHDIEGLLNLLFSHRTSLIFAIENVSDSTVTGVENVLFDRAIGQPNARMEHMLNIPLAINTLVDNFGIVIYPNGSEDFGGVYLDIFAKTEMIQKIGKSD